MSDHHLHDSHKNSSPNLKVDKTVINYRKLPLISCSSYKPQVKGSSTGKQKNTYCVARYENFAVNQKVSIIVSYVIKEFAHAFSCAYIELQMHLGSLESTQEARVALGYRLVQLLRIFRALQTSRMHP